MRTTIDIDAAVLMALKRLQQREGKSLGRLVSDLLAQTLAGQAQAAARRPAFHWISKPMRARVDLDNREALREATDKGRAV